MTVVFLNMVLLPLAALVLVPLLLHLFARTRPPAYNFSSLEFILRSIRRTNRIRKPQDLILLVLRSLFFAAVILMFLQPLFFSKKRLTSPFERKNTVLVVDATASMAYPDGAQTRFAAACAEASAVLSGLSARDTANIVWIRSRPAAVFPQMGVNFSYLQSELRRAGVTAEAGNVSESLRLAFRLLEGVEGRREVVVISDFQKTGWEKIDVNMPVNVDVIKVKVGNDPGINGAITGIYLDPARPLASEEVAVCAEVHNYSGQPRRRTVFLGVQDSRQSQDVMIPAWSKATVVFRHKFGASGIFPIRVALNEDSFVLDDARWMLAEVRESLHVGIVGGEQETAATWRRALDALGWARTEMVSSGQVASAGAFDAVMFSGDDGSGIGRMLAKADRPCTVIWAPAVSGAALPVSNAAPASFAWESASVARRAKIVGEKDEVFRLFADGSHGDPVKGAFSGRFVTPAAAFAEADILAAYDDGVPALARFKSGRNLYLWNLSVRSEFSDYASGGGFLPLLGEIILSGRAHRDRGAEGGDFLPGDRVVIKVDGEIAAAGVRLEGPGGKPVMVEEQRTVRDAMLVSVPCMDPGLYTWMNAGRQMGNSVVNFPVVESDLRTMTMDEMETRGAVSVRGGGSVNLLREGVKLWPILLALAVLLAVAEAGVLLWAERT